MAGRSRRPVGDGRQEAVTFQSSPYVDRADRAPTPAIELSSVSFGYPGAPDVVSDFSLTIAPSEILVIIGPSGCGKSTVLNLIAGIVAPTSGQITFNGTLVNGLNKHVSYMTQKDTLLPWRSAVDNAALPLEIRGVPRRERLRRATAQLERLGVGGFEDHRPHQLSGGMRSRTAMARALLSDADTLLFDEPFAAIDALVRVKLQELLLSVWQETRKTIVYVTHDLNEAITLGHRVIVMGRRPGRVQLVRIIETPHPRDVARFRTSAEAQEAYVELWNTLEQQVNR